MTTLTLTSGITVDIKEMHLNIKRLINRVYKLLPMREQGQDWEKLLETLIQELNGLKRLIYGQDDLFIIILCKMEGLFSLTKENDIKLYRRIIFECLNLLNKLDENVCNR